MYEHNQSIVQINELINRCNTLEFELAMLEYHEKTILFIRLNKEEEPPMIERDELDVVENKNEKFDTKSIVKYEKETENYMSNDENTSEKSTSNNTKQTE